MTREEAEIDLNQAKIIKHQFSNGMTDIEFEMKFNMHITNIYNDFESRTCENCKYGCIEEDEFVFCEIIGTDFLVNFGCNKFEKK